MAEEPILDQQAQGRLKAFVDRLERIDVERTEATDNFNDVLKEAAGQGYDKAALRKVVRLRKKDRAKRKAEDAVLDTYLVALGEA